VRRYLRTLLVALATLVGGLVAITATGYALGMVEAANHDIYEYQRNKLATDQRFDIVFVGDSSLGNAIDAARFGELSGRPTVNLALNGSYGSGGAYNMVHKVFDRQTPSRIVVMLSIDTMRRDDAFPGFFFSAEPNQLLTTSPVRMLELYFSLKTARRVLEQVWAHGLASRPTRFAGDYIGQGNRLEQPAREAADHPLLPNMVAKAQLAYIERIAQACKSHGVTCLYAHGPIYDGYCRQATEYVNALNEGIRAAGLDAVAGTPLCIPEEDVGDSIDHVRADLKDAYTLRYFELLREGLGGAAP
jgi:hypothetical protein